MTVLQTSSGHIYAASWGIEIPTDFDVLDSGDWTDLGFISEDGFHTVTTPSFHPRRHWNSLAPNIQLPAGYEETVAFTPLDFSEFVVAFQQAGGQWSTTAAGSRRYDPPARTSIDAWSLICDTRDGTTTVRTVIERCIVTSPIDHSYNAQPTVSEVTLALCPVVGAQPWWQYVGAA